jgi:hypothetical protein
MELLGLCFDNTFWDSVLKAVMDCERDSEKALEVVEKLAKVHHDKHPSPSVNKASKFTSGNSIHSSPPPELQTLESALLHCVDELIKRKQIKGSPLSLDEMLDPPGEKIDKEGVDFADDDEIIAKVRHEAAIERGEVEEVDSDDENDEGGERMGTKEMLEMCKVLEGACISSGVVGSLDLAKHLRGFHGVLRQHELQNVTQSTLENFFS